MLEHSKRRNVMARAMLLLLMLAVIAPAAGCGIPRDPEGTFGRIQRGTLRVGVAPRPPWTINDSEPPGGIESQLLAQWAAKNDLQVEWLIATERDLVDSLRRGDIHVAIAGFTDDNPWSDQVGMTQPYAEWQDGSHVMLVRQGENRWLLELDRHLQARRAEVVRLLDEASSP